MRSSRDIIGATLVLGALSLSGCGASSDPNESTPNAQPLNSSSPRAEAPATATLRPSPSRASASAEPGAGQAEAEATYIVEEFAFAPVSVAPGALVEVINRDAAPHTLSAADGTFDTGLFTSEKGGRFRAPSVAGSYPIVCKIHTSMKGVLVVSEDA